MILSPIISHFPIQTHTPTYREKIITILSLEVHFNCRYCW